MDSHHSYGHPQPNAVREAYAPAGVRVSPAADLDLVATMSDLHGHNHSWQYNILYSLYARKPMIRLLGIPSIGMDQDIGFAVLHTLDDRIEFSQIARHFSFPVKTAKEERRRPWDGLVAKRNGRRMSFLFGKLARESGK